MPAGIGGRGFDRCVIGQNKMVYDWSEETGL
jgi:hypothetical protein